MSGLGQCRFCSGVDVTTGSTPVRSGDVSRRKIVLVNDGANKIYIALSTDGSAPTATVGNGIPLQPNGGSWTDEDYQGPIAAIAVTATTRLCVTEL